MQDNQAILERLQTGKLSLDMLKGLLDNTSDVQNFSEDVVEVAVRGKDAGLLLRTF